MWWGSGERYGRVDHFKGRFRRLDAEVRLVILTISTTHVPATDLGFLLHKHPDRHHELEFSYGMIHVIYPEASPERCSASVIVDIDPVGLVRNRRGPSGGESSLAQYLNDRPYALSSFMSVALAKAFGTAMSGRSKERPDLAETPIPLEIDLPVTPCRGGSEVLGRLFEPLGYEVAATSIPLDEQFPAWGPSRYLSVRLFGTKRLKDALEHLFVLLPVLDDDKHYWVGKEEIDKLLRRGGDWLVTHPDRELITRRYLRHDRLLTNEALTRLMEDTATDLDEAQASHDAEEEAIERPLSLNQQRLEAVIAALEAAGAKRILDLGCGSGKLVSNLLKVKGIEKVVGVDVSHRALQVGARRLHLESMAPHQRERVELLQGSLTYRDRRLEGFDAAAVVEVVEHLEPTRLDAFERVLFGRARPGTVVLSTPNAEYNVRFDSLPAGQMRHRDHRFEWSRQEFADWSAGVAERNGYQVAISGIRGDDPEVGSPTQMAVFSR
jgi:3' terminal RNA ribose 2'-O-methyltransferase Hen1